MKKIGITGSSGLLGKLLIKELKKIKLKYSNFTGDITNSSKVNNWLKSQKNINYIFHFAAFTSVIRSKQNKKKSYITNVMGTKNLLKSIKQTKKKIFLFFPSTSHVYSFSKKPITEKDLTLPISYYGKTKLLAEREIRLYKNKNFEYFIGRIFSIFNRNQKKPFLYPTVKYRIKKMKSKKIYIKNANCVRDFTNAEKLIKIILQIYKKKLSGTYNIGSGKGTSIKEFIYKTITKKKEILTNNVINVSVANINKLKKAKIKVN